MVRRIFAGFLADLLGQKEITEWKGTGGNVCCIECSNVHKRARGPNDPRGVGLDCADQTKYARRSNEEVFAIVDTLAIQNTILTVAQFEKEETRLGFNFVANGLLMDHSLRGIYKPVDHTIRDWQHTVTSDGVANTCIAETLSAISEKGYKLAHVRSFASLINLPSKYGAIHLNWLSDARMKKHTLTSFSGTILTLFPIIQLFLEKYCCDDPDLVDVCRVYKLLYVILGLLSSGPDAPMHHMATMERLIQEFHELFALCSRSLKPKLHHLRHILGGIRWLGKCLSCFVTERKHRSIKASALHVFRHIEHTVLADVVNKQCQQMTDGHDLFKNLCLVNPRVVQGRADLERSNTAVLPCGAVRHGDVVWFKDATCGRVECFYKLADTIAVDVRLFRNVWSDLRLLDETRQTRTIVDVNTLVDSCIWYYDAPAVIKVSMPALGLF